MTKKERVIAFLWQHFMLLISLFIMTLGVAVCVRSMLGSSVISTIPYVFEQAGGQLDCIPDWTIGEYTIIMNAMFVVLQILILRRDFEPMQLVQVFVGFVFGYLIDINMWLTSWLLPTLLWQKAIAQIVGCSILGIGIALEVKCGSITMPGEGLPIAISRVLHKEFPKVKIAVDCTLVCIAISFCFIFFGAWQWHIIGFGTIFAMVYVGIVVKAVGRHLRWFEKLLGYRPGFRRYVYGLAKYIKR